MSARRHDLIALAAGIVFGLGLAVSQMIEPLKVLAFLDVAGDWDPSLALVLAAAVAVTLPGFRFVLRTERPVFGAEFDLPVRRRVDRPLLVGATLFGLGWGLGGYCPGPAIAALATLHWEPVVLIVSMLAGSLVHRAASARGWL